MSWRDVTPPRGIASLVSSIDKSNSFTTTISADDLNFELLIFSTSNGPEFSGLRYGVLNCRRGSTDQPWKLFYAHIYLGLASYEYCRTAAQFKKTFLELYGEDF
jgi:hypothetical protein